MESIVVTPQLPATNRAVAATSVKNEPGNETSFDTTLSKAINSKSNTSSDTSSSSKNISPADSDSQHSTDTESIQYSDTESNDSDLQPSQIKETDISISDGTPGKVQVFLEGDPKPLSFDPSTIQPLTNGTSLASVKVANQYFPALQSAPKEMQPSMQAVIQPAIQTTKMDSESGSNLNLNINSQLKTETTSLPLTQQASKTGETSAAIKTEGSPVKIEGSPVSLRSGSDSALFTATTVTAKAPTGQTLQPSTVTQQQNFFDRHGVKSASWTIEDQNKPPMNQLQLNSGTNTLKIPDSQPMAKTFQSESIAASLTQIADVVEPHKPLRSAKPGLRQDIAHQFIQAKSESIEIVNQKNGNTQNFDSPDEQANNSTFQQGATKIGEPLIENGLNNSFSQMSSEKISILTSEPGKLTSPFSQNTLFEENILNQLSQKLKIQRIVQDQKIAIKLHPAELGELKIDVQLRDGSVNASIAAQSQQVLDILEKNMPRLKALMEQQGLKVNDLSVVLDPDVNSEQNLFEEQLSQEENGFGRRHTTRSQNTFSLFEEEIEAETIVAEETQRNVNVTI